MVHPSTRENGGDTLKLTGRRYGLSTAAGRAVTMAARPVGAVLLAVALVLAALLVPAAQAAAAGTVPTVPSDSDGSCDTAPASYPADGEPVPDEASCTLVIGPDDAVVGEVWSWRDAASVHWYSYPAASTAELTEGSVLMCASTDPATAGVVYMCSADSAYLLFAVSSVFVEWPAPPTGPLHYCQAVRFEGGASDVTGTACASVALADTGTPTPTPSPLDNLATVAPTPSPTPEPTASEPPLPAPTTASPTSAPAHSTPAGPASPSAEPVATTPPLTSTSVLPTPAPDTGAVAVPTLPAAGAEPAAAAVSTPLESASVAVVGGARFPLGFVIALAVALAVGGIVMLSGPGFAARRHRR